MIGCGAGPTLAQCERDFLPITALLHMGGIGLGQRTMQTVFGPVGIDPLPHIALSALRACDVDGTAVAIAAGPPAATVQ